jgi:amino acid transporter
MVASFVGGVLTTALRPLLTGTTRRARSPPRTFPRALTAALGPLLQYILLAASVTSKVGVLCALMCTTSRALVAMAQLRMLPGPLARLHPSLGSPYLAIALNIAIFALATTLLHLEALLEITMFFYAVIVQCATVLDVSDGTRDSDEAIRCHVIRCHAPRAAAMLAEPSSSNATNECESRRGLP